MSAPEREPGRVEVAGIEQAAQALAAAVGEDWGQNPVRNRCRGLALTAVAAYLAAADAQTGGER
ncbi:hypothetical protein ACFXPA_44170 [Amycolatopsis sp. NPDC059090]|uniref:hypothetical protein n=1 Tax=unclassified Amycolatopsis TaxID=2618356 RepID=UPI00367246CE